MREPTPDIEKKVLSTDQLCKVFVSEVLFSSVPFIANAVVAIAIVAIIAQSYQG